MSIFKGKTLIQTDGTGSFGNMVLNAAIETGVKKIVCLSTEKAAYPINTMGTSKAMMEKIILAKSHTVPEEKIKICCTRYGNVMCSRSSVIPLFKSSHDKIFNGLKRGSRLDFVRVQVRTLG